MKIPITPSFVESDTHWHRKGNGAIFVEKEEHRETVFKILCEQDDYWEIWENKLEEIIHVAPKEAGSRIALLNDYGTYAGRTDIYDVQDFIDKCAEQGIGVLVLSDYLSYG